MTMAFCGFRWISGGSRYATMASNRGHSIQAEERARFGGVGGGVTRTGENFLVYTNIWGQYSLTATHIDCLFMSAGFDHYSCWPLDPLSMLQCLLDIRGDMMVVILGYAVQHNVLHIPKT